MWSPSFLKESAYLLISTMNTGDKVSCWNSSCCRDLQTADTEDGEPLPIYKIRTSGTEVVQTYCQLACYLERNIRLYGLYSVVQPANIKTFRAYLQLHPTWRFPVTQWRQWGLETENPEEQDAWTRFHAALHAM